MSIEKLDFKGMIKERQPFTTFLNNVIQNIHDTDSLSVWVYLVSLPPSWKVDKEHLMTHFKMGERRLENVFAFLRRVNLLQYVQTRDKNNTIRGWSINVLCGDKFDKDGHLKNKKATPQDLQPVDNPTPQVSTPVAFHPDGESAHINTTISTKEKEKQREAPPPKNSLFFFEPTKAALKAAAAKGLDLAYVRQKFVANHKGKPEYSPEWPFLFEKWVIQERLEKKTYNNESTFADVTKQSTSYGYEVETPDESHRKWLENMRSLGYETQSG